MKAILEFNYPEDETKLRHAIHGKDAVMALLQIRDELSTAARLSVLVTVKKIVDETLREIGEI